MDDDLPNGIINDLRDGMTYDDFEDEYDMSQDKAREAVEELRSHGVDISEQTVDQYGKKLYIIEEDNVDDQYTWEREDGEYKFAVISDTHLGSDAEHLEELNDFYDRVVEEDINVVFHAGDISDGDDVYRGHSQHKVPEAIGWGRLEDYVVENYPERDGVVTAFIEGNHDRKLYKDTGVRFGEQIAERREDLELIGDCFADVTLDEEHDVNMQLVHPSGGVPYTPGYRAMTWLRDRDDEDKADITVFGHLHKFINAHVEGSEALYGGAWQGETPYLQRKGIKPEVGGWIIEMELEDGDIRSWQTDRVQYDIRQDDSDVSVDDINNFLDGE